MSFPALRKTNEVPKEQVFGASTKPEGGAAYPSFQEIRGGAVINLCGTKFSERCRPTFSFNREISEARNYGRGVGGKHSLERATLLEAKLCEATIYFLLFKQVYLVVGTDSHGTPSKAIHSLQNCWLFESPAHFNRSLRKPARENDSTGVTAVVNEGLLLLRGECVLADAGARETAQKGNASRRAVLVPKRLMTTINSHVRE
ncbi:hypothetical protein PC120_g26097 [Phytophthora cactorum]|nr:hypothetical protein PC120_g26097 [Phytophthora cactorum]